MKKIITLLASSFVVSACSTTSTNNLASQMTNAQTADERVCFYSPQQGSHFKQKTCMSKKAYNNLYRVSFLPSPKQKPIYVDQLPNSGK